MRFLIIDARYPVSLLEAMYARHTDYGQLGYRAAWRALMDEGLGVADFYSRSLKKLGHEAEEVVPGCELLQRQWAVENGLKVPPPARLPGSVRRLLQTAGRWVSRTGMAGGRLYETLKKPFRTDETWVEEILAAQVERARPDVLLSHALGEYDRRFLRRVRPFVKLMVAQHGSLLPPEPPLDCYDLIVSSLPNLVNEFRSRGVRTEYLRLGFGASVLDRLGTVDPIYDVGFVGGYSGIHLNSTRLLEHVAGKVPVDFWGYGTESLAAGSPVHRRYHGEAWGTAAYRIMAQSRIVLNRHVVRVSENYANNMRLYEATGVGTMLLTDMKENLPDLFEVGKEVVAYRSAEECVELVKYYLDHEHERQAIAKAGQQRTLREHTYFHRMQELVEIIGRYMP